MHLNIFVSQSCFVHCKGCYSMSREEQKGKVVPTGELISFLKYANSVGVKKVTLCGGDPLSREDIIELLERIKDIGFTISLDTVGTPIIKDAITDNNKLIKQVDAKKLAELVDVIGIPIDGSKNEIFKKFRQTNLDIVNQQIAICQELNQAGANVCVNTVAHKGNLEDATELAELINKLDFINKWQVFQYFPMGKFGLKNRKQFEISEEQFLDFKDKALGVFKDNSNKVQFKSAKDRQNAYMLIDNSGNAWIPASKDTSTSKLAYLFKKNIAIGNITNKEDWNKICSYLDRDMSSNVAILPTTKKSDKTEREEFINAMSNNGEYRKPVALQELPSKSESKDIIYQQNQKEEER